MCGPTGSHRRSGDRSHPHGQPPTHPCSPRVIRAGNGNGNVPGRPRSPSSARTHKHKHRRLARHDEKVALSLSSLLSGAIRPGHRPDHFYGISLQGGRSFASRLFGLIPRLPSGTSEIMTHPGHADCSLRSHDSYNWQREEELVVLLSHQFRELLDQHDIQLTDFASLGSSTVG